MKIMLDRTIYLHLQFIISYCRLREEKMDDEILTVEELARYLKISERTIYELLKKKEIPGFKVGATWRFKKSVIDEWIKTKIKGVKHGSSESMG